MIFIYLLDWYLCWNLGVEEARDIIILIIGICLPVYMFLMVSALVAPRRRGGKKLCW